MTPGLGDVEVAGGTRSSAQRQVAAGRDGMLQRRVGQLVLVRLCGFRGHAVGGADAHQVVHVLAGGVVLVEGPL